jgi:hypothetical protein
MAGVISAPRIVFTFANVVLVGVFRWPPCHIVNSTPDAISKRVNHSEVADMNTENGAAR